MNSVGVKLYSIGCVQNVSKFQNPEIKANALCLYVFELLSYHRLIELVYANIQFFFDD